MPKLTLLDDQPAEKDLLHFQRYVDALDKTVFAREAIAPLVVGVFGEWGSGKTTLLDMLEKHLASPSSDEVGCLENYLRARRLADFPRSKWVVVKFSPWLYRNEKSLLLPLLATLAKQQPAFDKLVRQIVKSGPRLIKKLTGTLIDPTTTGLSLLAFLDSVQQDKSKAKDLQEKIAEAVKTVTGTDRRLVFLIDDLDRCHDSKHVVNLLEQIKLFLHLDRCLFFIAADRAQIVKAIDKEFAGSGEAYLEKFVQLPFELPPHLSQHVVDVLNAEDNEKKAFCTLSEVLENNPRKVKQLWNEAQVMREVLESDPNRSSDNSPMLKLILKWLLLRNCGNLRSAPYRYLQFEREKKRDEFTKSRFIELLDCKDKNGVWRSEFHRKLAVYLWNDLDGHKFHKADTLAMYAFCYTEKNTHRRSQIEEDCFSGDAKFSDEPFVEADLSGGHFHNAVFSFCDFELADFTHADLTHVQFVDCKLKLTKFDNATLLNTKFIRCQ
ncbi:MAG: P-loop NTPase fold protein [Gallionella sp.]